MNLQQIYQLFIICASIIGVCATIVKVFFILYLEKEIKSIVAPIIEDKNKIIELEINNLKANHEMYNENIATRLESIEALLRDLINRVNK
jgi:uncharacterized protein YsxB (DUF464 family)